MLSLIASQVAGPDPAWIAALVSLCVALLGLLGWCARWAWRLLRRTMQFLEDWAGEPARPGAAARPGVMARLQGVEEMVAEVSGQMTLNGGHSMHDTVQATANDVKTVKAELTALSGRVELFEKRRVKQDG